MQAANVEDDKAGEERAAQRGSERILAKARAQRKRREQQRQVLIPPQSVQVEETERVHSADEGD